VTAPSNPSRPMKRRARTAASETAPGSCQLPGSGASDLEDASLVPGQGASILEAAGAVPDGQALGVARARKAGPNPGGPAPSPPPSMSELRAAARRADAPLLSQPLPSPGLSAGGEPNEFPQFVTAAEEPDEFSQFSTEADADAPEDALSLAIQRVRQRMELPLLERLERTPAGLNPSAGDSAGLERVKAKMRERAAQYALDAAPQPESPRQARKKLFRRIRRYLELACGDECAELGCIGKVRWWDGRCDKHTMMRGASGKTEPELYVTQWSEFFKLASDVSLGEHSWRSKA
jgi:hypothetical protein